jgi:hypothetical protein
MNYTIKYQTISKVNGSLKTSERSFTYYNEVIRFREYLIITKKRKIQVTKLNIINIY